MPLQCKLYRRFQKLTIRRWWPKSKKRGSFRDPECKIKVVPCPDCLFTLNLGAVLVLVVAKVLLPGLVYQIRADKVSTPTQSQPQSSTLGAQNHSQSGGFKCFKCGESGQSVRIVERLLKVLVTRHFSLSNVARL